MEDVCYANYRERGDNVYLLCEGMSSESWRFCLKKVKIAKQPKAGLYIGEGSADVTNVVFKGRHVELCTSQIIKNINSKMECKDI